MKSYRLSTLILLVVAAVIGLSAGTSHAQLTVLDDFSTYTTGSNFHMATSGSASAGLGNWITQTNAPGWSGTMSVVANTSGAGSANMLQMVNSCTNNFTFACALPLTMTAGDTSTLFFQAYLATNPNGCYLAGASTNSSGGGGFVPGTYAGYVEDYTPTSGGPGSQGFYDRNGTLFNSLPTAPYTIGNTWFDVWLVFNTTANTYSVDIAAASDPSTILASATGQSYRAGTGALTYAVFNDSSPLLVGSSANVVANYANIYFDPKGNDMGVNPISVPEPGSLSLLALGAGALGFLIRRRRA